MDPVVRPLPHQQGHPFPRSSLAMPFGPPPLEPTRPNLEKVNHVLHGILSLLTWGMWLLVWAFIAICVSQNNGARMERYEREYEEWRHAYHAWQYSLPREY
jgi:hypothetical protein